MSESSVEIDTLKRYQIGWQHFFVIAMGLLFLPSRFEIEYSLIFSYPTHKLLHILGVIIFVGNVLVNTIWMVLAYRTKNNEVILFTSKSIDWLEKEYEIHHPNMPYISTWNYDLDQLKENPRYIELLKKMNLTLPGE